MVFWIVNDYTSDMKPPLQARHLPEIRAAFNRGILPVLNIFGGHAE
jgi:hypothetical protein